MNKPKKIPMRKCLATNVQYPKKDMFRVVRTPEGTVVIDLKGKTNGRGAYISKTIEAINLAEKKKVLDRELEVHVEKAIYEELRKLVGETIE